MTAPGAVRDPTVLKNQAYFGSHGSTYAALISRLKTYRNLRVAADDCLSGCGTLLDIGNGGVFAYDASLPTAITAIDVFPADTTGWPAHAHFQTGDALDLPVVDHTFDTVFASMLIHHLAGQTVAETRGKLDRFLAECRRAAKSGGRIVLCEACVPRWFFRLECLAYERLHRTLAPRMRHPLTLQFTVEEIRTRMSQAFQTSVTVRHVRKGAIVLHFGWPFPAVVTPVQSFIFTCQTR